MAGRGAVVTGAPDREAGATEPSSSADRAGLPVKKRARTVSDASTRPVGRVPAVGASPARLQVCHPPIPHPPRRPYLPHFFS